MLNALIAYLFVCFLFFFTLAINSIQCFSNALCDFILTQHNFAVVVSFFPDSHKAIMCANRAFEHISDVDPKSSTHRLQMRSRRNNFNFHFHIYWKFVNMH